MLSFRRYLPTLALVVALATLVAPGITPVAADAGDFAGGDGSAEDPYQITDWYQLDAVRDHLTDHFILMNDLDSTTAGYDSLAGPDANGDAGWEPIGEFGGSSFGGSFDGQGYDIAGLVINRVTEIGVGLFGVSGGTVEAVGLVGGSISGSSMVGGLVGWNLGTIMHCSAGASVTGDSFVGGLVGSHNSGYVGECYASGNVSGDTCVGGLEGLACGEVVSCYATGSVAGTTGFAGGLVGKQDQGEIVHCYSTGSVVAPAPVGGLMGGKEAAAEVVDSFWNTESSGQSTSADGTGKTTLELMDIETFSAWDIAAVCLGEIDRDATWNIIEGASYPVSSIYREEFGLTEGWNMVSLSLTCPADGPTVEEVFGDEIEAIYCWDPEGKSYTVPTTLSAGCGYWVAVSEDKVIRYVA